MSNPREKFRGFIGRQNFIVLLSKIEHMREILQVARQREPQKLGQIFDLIQTVTNYSGIIVELFQGI